MITRIKSDRIVLPSGIASGYVYFEDGVITAVTSEELGFDSEYDFCGRYVSPGFIDIHTHGGGGFDFSFSAEDVIGAANFHFRHGTTSIMPTISAAPIEDMERAVEYTDAAMRDGRLLANIIGVHLEGPYLSLKQSGAQSPSFITPPDREKYLPVLEKWGKIITK
jgi:N-acetylglucosamine-6-phosphate deacetylase